MSEKKHLVREAGWWLTRDHQSDVVSSAPQRIDSDRVGHADEVLPVDLAMKH